MSDFLPPLIGRWKSDPCSTYQSWFLWDQRLKNFRSIRRGLALVAREIEAGTFGNAYRGSSLETVVGSVAEQRQIFKGADHAFLWKPKLRIPDIYEHAGNQRAFGRLLQSCDCCETAEDVVAAIHRIDALGIKGLGPAVANLLYFIHPTFVCPFNTAIVKGFNALTGANIKLGRWDHYLSMRQGVLRLNEQHRGQLSNDLGAIAGLLFEIGSGRYNVPPVSAGDEEIATWEADLQRAREESAVVQRALSQDEQFLATHTAMQGRLRDLGLSLGFSVWIAANDRTRPYGGGMLGDGCLQQLPIGGDGLDTVRLIDVLWLERDAAQVAAAFEVEHTTSIHSGIVRMLDLAFGSGVATSSKLFLVAPDDRRDQVAQQLRRPAFSHVTQLGIRYLPYSQLHQHGAAIERFGAGLKPIMEISQLL